MIKIVAAAVRYEDIIFSMPAPARHHNILHAIAFKLDPNDESHLALKVEQGFLADNGRFYGRIGAKQIVKDFKQATIANHHPNELFSEDLW